MTKTLAAIIGREGDLYVATCPQFDVVTQGRTIQEARDNLKEAVELFLECASPAEKAERFRSEFHITDVEVAVGQARWSFPPKTSSA